MITKLLRYGELNIPLYIYIHIHTYALILILIQRGQAHLVFRVNVSLFNIPICEKNFRFTLFLP